MFERFTDQARFVIVRAQEEAVSLRHREIGTQHLLIGVLQVDDPAVRAALQSFDVTLDSVREAVGRPARRRWRAPSGHIPFTEPARRALEQSLRVAADLHQRLIEPVHLLLAALADHDSEAVHSLQANGVDLAALNAAVRAAAGDRRP